MAAACVRAELTNGEKQQRVSAPVENDLKSLIRGINDVRGKLSDILNKLVEREGGAGTQGEDDDDDDEDSDSEPDPKKPKT